MLFNKDALEIENTNESQQTFGLLIWDKLMFLFHLTIRTICHLFHILKFYMLWMSLHYIASQLYIELCVPKTVYGFLVSPFITSTPQCQSLRWAIYNGASMISNMWLVLGTWITTKLLIQRNNAIDIR